ncbi:hypothetical protein THRCLA_08954 [Thraustotheca clavata]|uniref:Uncharacterized protein n=1 Tax=Thraustotheca clavata TaxID=74557 RepID=A0A1V9Z0K2_9STRA|nr:hypothetical protein THRCLA_08954 [Thraustotheca clavata]
MAAISASVHSMLSNRKKRLLLMGLITLLAFCVILAAVISTFTQSSGPSASNDQQSKENAASIAEKYSTPTTPPSSNHSTPSASSNNSSDSSTNSSTFNTATAQPTTPQPTTPPPQPRVCSANDATTPCYVPPASTAYCRLDTQLDAHLQYVFAPFASNTNAGFAMDRACASGERCAYACMSPYIPTSNGWSSKDCIPYTSLCPAYSSATARGGLQCVNGKTIADNPSQPLCVLGLNTSFVKSYLPKQVATCQVVNHGTAMTGFDLAPNQASQLASPPQWYWRGRGAKYYTGLPGVGNTVACQRNFDRLSLNAAGIDTMPYTLGGGSLFGSQCAECGQHTLAFGENYDSKKKYSSFPGYGIRVRNCNDFGCGDVQCDATYAFNPVTGEVEAYWVKYNTVFSSTSVGCVVDTVLGYGWGPNNGFAKYTLYEYYPVTINGQQSSTCSTCSSPSTFVPSTCGKIRSRTPPRFGTGSNPAMYVCTPVGAAVGLQSTIKILSSSNPSSSELSATVIAEIVVASVLCLIVIGIGAKAKSLQAMGPQVPNPITAPQSSPTNDISFTPERRSSLAATRFEGRASTTGAFALT